MIMHPEWTVFFITIAILGFMTGLFYEVLVPLN